MDRMDLQVEMPPVTAADLALPAPTEGTEQAARRVAKARDVQGERHAALGGMLNARLEGQALESVLAIEARATALLNQAAETQGLSARAFTRTKRLARTIADLDGSGPVLRVHVAEALIYRKPTLRDGPAPTFRSAFAPDR